jgi:peptidoglycan/LPS O-acetylase OafA/YrhL
VISIYLFQVYTGEVYRQYLHIEQGLSGFIKHLLLFRGDGIFWTIPTEFMFYLVLPFIAMFLVSQKIYRYAIVCGLALSYGIYHLSIYIGVIELPSLKFIEVNKHSQYFDVFSIGVVFGVLSKNTYLTKFYENYNKALDLSVFLMFISGVIISIVLVCKSIFIFDQPFYNIRFVSFLYAVLFSLALYSAQKGNSYLRSIFESKILVYMGVVGYSWYLLHMPVLQVVNQLDLAPWQLFSISTVVITVLSTISYLLIEEPFIRLGKRLSRKSLTKKSNGLANARH